MALLIPDVGEVILLKRLLYPTNSGETTTTETWKCRLFKNDVTPAEADTAVTFTEADFTGYTAGGQTLTQATWGTPATAAGVTSSTYGAELTWTLTGTSQTIYGYYITGTTSTTLIYAERFGAAITLTDTQSLGVTPKITLD